MTVSELKKGFVSIERVKKGGQKIVYKATRPDTSIVALKVINNATGSTSTSRNRGCTETSN